MTADAPVLHLPLCDQQHSSQLRDQSIADYVMLLPQMHPVCLSPILTAVAFWQSSRHPLCQSDSSRLQQAHTEDRSSNGGLYLAGFLCDEMGLGKTLETLMLVLASQPPKGWAVHDLKKVQRPAAASTAAEPLPIKSTLIVMPANLLQQWQDELALHVKQGSLKW